MQILSAKVSFDYQTDRSRGYGFVVYKNEEDAKSALRAMEGQSIGGRRIEVSNATSKDYTHNKHCVLLQGSYRLLLMTFRLRALTGLILIGMVQVQDAGPPPKGVDKKATLIDPQVNHVHIILFMARTSLCQSAFHGK